MLTFLTVLCVLSLLISVAALWYARRVVREARWAVSYVRSARAEVKTWHDRLTAEAVTLPFPGCPNVLRIADTGDTA
ncbi:hypothetical protein VT84_33285 [Gemmata sp. SH-PL17]|uniref:hypothetical protein n=1 Tax=Gemmata sp. SH-PL17 TaxID=1630693 RepID=UPI00078B7F8A|nr:hypothetical protein [Gemmata sp. SH-PL17]AMV29317.1 hypothetical protein VT84_33285 [Gemmata sp. SH-PL17]